MSSSLAGSGESEEPESSPSSVGPRSLSQREIAPPRHRGDGRTGWAGVVAPYRPACRIACRFIRFPPPLTVLRVACRPVPCVYRFRAILPRIRRHTPSHTASIVLTLQPPCISYRAISAHRLRLSPTVAPSRLSNYGEVSGAIPARRLRCCATSNTDRTRYAAFVYLSVSALSRRRLLYSNNCRAGDRKPAGEKGFLTWLTS